jgi:hypothetical protein
VTITLEDIYGAIGDTRTELTLIRQQIQEHGNALGVIGERCLLRGQTCMQRMQRQSDEVARVRDNSQVIRVEQAKQETIVLTALKVVGGITGLVAIGAVLYKFITWLAKI